MNDFRNRPDLARGIRNNNPGNLIITNIAWQGKVMPSQDPKFETFQSIEWGLRALVRDLITKINRYNGSIRDIMYQYAPPSENRTQNYIDIVQNKLGKNWVRVCREDLYEFAKAVARVENGNDAYLIPDESFQWALNANDLESCAPTKNKGLLTAMLLFIGSQL